LANFTVVDLGSQARAVARHVEGWTNSTVLTWLSQCGEVILLEHPHFRSPGIDTYIHVTACGWGGAFWFEPGKLVLQERIGNEIRFVEVALSED
jgi:hypothetical protein